MQSCLYCTNWPPGSGQPGSFGHFKCTSLVTDSMLTSKILTLLWPQTHFPFTLVSCTPKSIMETLRRIEAYSFTATRFQHAKPLRYRHQTVPHTKRGAFYGTMFIGKNESRTNRPPVTNNISTERSPPTAGSENLPSPRTHAARLFIHCEETKEGSTVHPLAAQKLQSPSEAGRKTIRVVMA